MKVMRGGIRPRIIFEGRKDLYHDSQSEEVKRIPASMCRGVFDIL